MHNQVELPELFKSREQSKCQVIAPQRIFIRGRAGVGKTTLSKKIVYDFIHHDPWKALFDRILWVPLRRLKSLPKGFLDLEGLFLTEYFPDNPKGRDLAHGLWVALADAKYRRTLFVLDGLDEVSEGLDESNNMYRLLRKLLKMPHAIVTSRPHGSLPNWLKGTFDLDLEAIGFYPEQVKAYARMAFKHDETKLNNFRSFLRDHWLIEGLVRIPIVLDALCFTWDNACRHKSILETMTTLYREIELRLLQKDICRSQQLPEYECQTMNRRRVEKKMNKEIRLLEALAFSGLCNNVLEFDQRDRKKVYDVFDLSVTESSIEGSSFLRTSDSSSGTHNLNYHFLHLTFQEYFAARYFVRQWNNNEYLRYPTLGCHEDEDANVSTPVEFLGQHKYMTSYDITWRFVAGLLDIDGPQGAVRFFDAIEKQQPSDLTSPSHQGLITHCLSEVSANFPPRQELEQHVSDWLLQECKAGQNVRLVREMECPERVLNSALQKANDDGRVTILRSLERRPSIPVSTVELAAPWLGHGINSHLKVCICNMLKSTGEHVPDGLKEVPKQLEDNNWEVGEAAVEALTKQRRLSDDILKEVAARLGHQDSDVRRAATCVLDHQSSLSDNVLKKVVDLLDRKSWGVRRTAIDTLVKQPSLSDRTLKDVAARLGQKGSHRRRAAIYVLERQSCLSNDIIKTVVDLLDEEALDVEHSATNALRRQRNLSDSMIKDVFAWLSHTDLRRREAAISILAWQSTISSDVLEIVLDLLDHADDHVRDAATETLMEARLSDKSFEKMMAHVFEKFPHLRDPTSEASRQQTTFSDNFLKYVAAWPDRQVSCESHTRGDRVLRVILDTRLEQLALGN
ncbi:hypothetical protein ASPCAL11771 [Aspergillus calidoustus]|uniref:NACHT domain-containing protein n=1 Tax=Aspergillus calidoustus TaxID=454130 RepID=A0A0U5GFK6_ASPCI|nr:hypothetical protein ASPCAL11771 [Aspergillus calidoustus]